jgi:hypothetical protein
VFEAMLEGWERQQKSRFLSEDGTITPRFGGVHRGAGVGWTSGDAVDDPVVSRGLGYVLEFVTDTRYGWLAECEQRFGQFPVQIAIGGTPWRMWSTTRASRGGGR